LFGFQHIWQQWHAGAGGLRAADEAPRSISDPQQVFPLAKVALEAHALGDLKCRDDAALDLLSTLACPFAG
jgi:hypothetical protein